MPLTVVLDKIISEWPKLVFVLFLFPRALKIGPNFHKLIFKKEGGSGAQDSRKSILKNLYMSCI